MKLYYFTFCYPYGNGEQWKANELNELVKQFDEITVVPYFYGGNFSNPKPLPKGVKLLGPLFNEIGLPGKKSDLIRILLHKNRLTFFKEFLEKKVYKRRAHLQSWMGSTLNAIRLLKHPVLKVLFQKQIRIRFSITIGGKDQAICFLLLKQGNSIRLLSGCTGSIFLNM